jgi:hypothetical protein
MSTEWWQREDYEQAKEEQTIKMKEVFEANPAAKLVMEKMVEWNNSVEITNGEDPSKLEDYLPWSEIEADQEINHRRFIVLSMSDGSEGGPASVYAFLDEDYHGKSWELELIVMEFDTGWNLVWGGEYDTGKMGFLKNNMEVERVDGQTTKIGLQEYSKEEVVLMAERPKVAK